MHHVSDILISMLKIFIKSNDKFIARNTCGVLCNKTLKMRLKTKQLNHDAK